MDYNGLVLVCFSSFHMVLGQNPVISYLTPIDFLVLAFLNKTFC